MGSSQFSLSLRLEILLKHVMGWALLAPVTHDAGRALHYLPCFAFLVNLAQTSPFSQLHVGINLDQRDSVFHAQGSDQFLIHGLVTVLGQDAEQCLSLVQGLGCLSNTPGKAISNQSLLEHLLDSGVNVHGPRGHGSRRYIISLNIRHGEFLDALWSLVEVNQAILAWSFGGVN